MEMGCYGIGVSRIVAAAIEQNNDLRGILWPLALAPFQVAIAPIGWGKSPEVRAQAKRVHDELSSAGVEVLLDDRDERPGVMFADLELIGIPHRITVGERSLKLGQVEYQARAEDKARPVESADAVQFVKSLCGK
jgi:prolyl-tRNA synthetase